MRHGQIIVLSEMRDEHTVKEYPGLAREWRTAGIMTSSANGRCRATQDHDIIPLFTTYSIRFVPTGGSMSISIEACKSTLGAMLLHLLLQNSTVHIFLTIAHCKIVHT